MSSDLCVRKVHEVEYHVMWIQLFVNYAQVSSNLIKYFQQLGLLYLLRKFLFFFIWQFENLKKTDIRESIRVNLVLPTQKINTMQHFQSLNTLLSSLTYKKIIIIFDVALFNATWGPLCRAINNLNVQSRKISWLKINAQLEVNKSRTDSRSERSIKFVSYFWPTVSLKKLR